MSGTWGRPLVPSLHDMTSYWLHGNSIPKIGCHYFWPVLIALPKNTQTYLPWG